MFKKVLVAVTVMVMMAVGVLADTDTVNGITWYYTVSYDGEACISDIPETTTGTITIPSSLGGLSVTSIGAKAFSGCSGLTSITIPDSVTSIGWSAFSSCDGLTKFIVDSNNPSYKSVNGLLLSKDGKTLIAGVNGDVVIPDSVTSIGDSAFSLCSGLTSVTIPNSVTSIGEYAFYYCEGLTSVTIGNSVTSIGEYAFGGCSDLTTVTIPNSVTSIGEYAFGGCSDLTTVTIPNSVTSIGGWAFSYCSGLTSITIGNSVTSIGDHAFEGCNNIKTATVGQYVSSKKLSLFAFYQSITNVVILNTVTNIGYSAFSYCSGLTSVTIPNSVTSIGSSAFSGCSGLTSVTIPNSVTSIGEYAFSDCSGLTSITIPDSVTSIGDWAFSGCWGLTSVTIGNSVTSIGGFYYCSGLTSVTIPDSVTSIEGFAFSGCSGLTSVTIGNSVTSIWQFAFSDCSGLTSITIPNTVTNIGYSAFEDCIGLTSVTIGNSVTSIGDEAFRDCDLLKSAIFLGDAPRDVGDAFFDDCADDFVIKVKKGTKGWNGDYTSTALPATWHGYPIEVYGSLQNASVSSSIAISSTMYDGTAKTNSLTIEYNGNTLINGLDFELSYLNNIDAGVASVIATGIGNFTDCLTNTFIITKRSVTLTSATETKVYDGTALKGESVTVSGDGFADGEGATYTFTGSQTDVGTSDNSFTYALNSNTKASNYEISKTEGLLTVTLMNFEDMVDPSKWSITLNGDNAKYDSTEKTVTIKSLSYDGVDITGCTLFGNTATEAGSYTLVATGNGNFKGTKDFNWTIAKRSVVLTSASASKVYDGLPLKADSVSIDGDGFASGEGASYSCIGAQTEIGTSANSFNYTLNSNTKASNYEITKVEGELTVTPMSFESMDDESKWSVILAGDGAKYDGTEKTAMISALSYDGIVITTYRISNNKATDAGEHLLTITGMGIFSGTRSIPWTIAKRSVVLTSASASKNYDGTPLTAETVTVSGDGFVDGEGVSYTFTGAQTEIGTSANSFSYTLTSNTKASNYEITTDFGTLTVSSVNLDDMTDSTKWAITLNGNNAKYDGTEKQVTVSSVSYDGVNISSYSVSGNKATDAGEHLLTITGMGIFSGTRSIPWTIAKRSVVLTSASASKNYDGTPLTAETVTVSGDGFVDGEGATYTFTGSQLDAGSSANSFSYTLTSNTKASNYEITKVEGELTVTTPLNPTTWYISPNGSDTNDGASWETAKATIQSAIDLSVAGDTIIVTNGVYAPITTSNKQILIESVEGAGATIIDGSSSTRCVTLGSSLSETNSILKGFTLRNGSAQNGAGVTGGILYNCTLINNTAENGGGAFESTLFDCTLTANTAIDGGAAHSSSLENCTLTGNVASKEGGASCDSILRNCTISGNTASNGGGASNSDIYNCTISDNTALKEGGGASSCALEYCTLTGNTASQSGGGAVWSTLNNCILSSNKAANGGGSSNGRLYNCLLTGNTASQSGGGDNSGTLYNCTLTSNSAQQGGGSYYGYLYNCISYGNNAPIDADICDPFAVEYTCAGTLKVTINDNTASSVLPGQGNIAADPLFVSAANGDFRIRATSPCVNKGSNQYADGIVDLDDYPRVHGDIIDMGAYEYCGVKRCDVIFNSTGGIVDPSTLSLNAGAMLGTLPVPVRAGYRFDGWFWNGLLVTPKTIASGKTMDVQARWTEEPTGVYHPVYRFYSKSYRGHFFTLDANERATLMCTNPNWKYEGIAYYAAKEQITGTVPLYRFYSKAYRGHFFTIDEEEMETVRDTNPNWKYEGIAYYVQLNSSQDTTPIYRFWSKTYRHHFYTMDEDEKDTLIRTNPNWKYEMIAFYAWPSLPTSTASLQSLSAPSMALADASISDGEDVAIDEATDTERSENKLDSVADWTLTVESDGQSVTSLGEMICEGFTLVTSEETPSEDELNLTGEEIEGLGFSLKIPEGEYEAYLWNAANDELIQNEATGGDFDFELPRLGSWYWFTIQDDAGEQPFGLWMKAE